MSRYFAGIIYFLFCFQTGFSGVLNKSLTEQGLEYFAAGKYAKAAQAFEQALGTNTETDNTQLLFHLGESYLYMGRSKKAVALFKKAAKPVQDKAFLSSIFFQIGRGYEEMGKRRAARRYFKKSYKTKKNPAAREKILSFLLKKKMFKGAKILEIKVLKQDVYVLSLAISRPFSGSKDYQADYYTLSWFNDGEKTELKAAYNLGLRAHSAYSLKFKDIDNDNIPEILFQVPAGVHSSSLKIIKTENGTFKKIAIANNCNCFFSDTPYIKVEDRDGDQLAEVVVKNRNYRLNPLKHNVTDVYRLEHGVYKTNSR